MIKLIASLNWENKFGVWPFASNPPDSLEVSILLMIIQSSWVFRPTATAASTDSILYLLKLIYFTVMHE